MKDVVKSIPTPVGHNTRVAQNMRVQRASFRNKSDPQWAVLWQKEGDNLKKVRRA
jgi:hypothetical protein